MESSGFNKVDTFLSSQVSLEVVRVGPYDATAQHVDFKILLQSAARAPAITSAFQAAGWRQCGRAYLLLQDFRLSDNLIDQNLVTLPYIVAEEAGGHTTFSLRNRLLCNSIQLFFT